MEIASFVDSAGRSVDLAETIRNHLSDGFDHALYVGTDSHIHGDVKKTKYSTAVVLHKKGKGGVAFSSSAFECRLASLRERLANETWRSVEVALALTEVFGDKLEIVVHIDCNKDKKFKSGKYSEELIGMVTGQGFRCVIKPDAFAAQSVADRFSR